jgi:uncharacterized membrane protein
MDDRTHRERSEGEAESSGTDADSEGWLVAAAGVWPAWLVAAGAIVVAVYFHLTESIWETEAEIFYAEIFAVVAVAALGYAVYEMRSRRSPF